jgi:hypothetical protein
LISKSANYYEGKKCNTVFRVRFRTTEYAQYRV